ncbi:SAM-dependent methyltransferase [Hyphomicrobium sp. CS1GBMeth3]|uniref:class I SAM-dependent methyltransferase n=1 Tax=Hyphomicrobium sp. CS1GBMeth3 TaxID=1892845 RepID=UPI000931D0DC|nr:SAM-dependent methyltransferase [Hyphomicrobium sp. CS1GBMeth3]
MTETALAAKLKARIRCDGPMSVADYVAACLYDPEHGYYRRRAAIGAAGDFVTAPEISQVFGEIIGLWSAVVWEQMGSPSRFNLVELGPGRGTLMRDALRAARVVPGFRAALAVHLVDSNATLRAVQAETLADAGVPLTFHEDINVLGSAQHVPEGPTLVIANEFLDALPISQLIYSAGAWHTRLVALDEERGAFSYQPGSERAPEPSALPTDRAPRDGDILETCASHAAVAYVLARRAALAPFAALFIDYGHAATGFGDTLQGVAGQSHVSPFHAPAETDLSAQVDFQQFADACCGVGLVVDGPVPQAEFLGRLGIVERASRLMSANPERAAEIEASVLRLIAPTGMGSRFLAIGVRSPSGATLPGLER